MAICSRGFTSKYGFRSLRSTKLGLVLNRKLNARNILLTQETKGQTVGYRCADGARYVQWLGFIERRAARESKGRPVRLVDISRVGWQNALYTEWRDLSEGEHVHGCLVGNGVYAVYDASVGVVGIS